MNQVQLHLPDLPTPAQQLLVQLLDPPSRLAWFQTCRAGRDQVLQHAPMLTVTIGTAHPVEQLGSDIARVSRIRGAQPTRLRLASIEEQRVRGFRLKIKTGSSGGTSLGARQAGVGKIRIRTFNSPAQQQHATALLGSLPSITHHITALDCGRAELSAPLLQAAARALPQLQHLTLQSLQQPLPATLPALPHLTHLAVNGYTETDLRFVKHYITQLRSLHLHGGQRQWGQHTNIPWQQLTSTPLPLLTSLYLPSTGLSRQLVHWLQTHAPALQQLTVHNLQVGQPNVGQVQLLQQQDNPGGTWGLQQLTLADAYQSVELIDIMKLPAPSAGLLTIVTHCRALLVTVQEPCRQQALLQRLSQCRLVGPGSAPLTSVDVRVHDEQRGNAAHMAQTVDLLLAVQPTIARLSVETYGAPLNTVDMQNLALLNQLPAAQWSLTGRVFVKDALSVRSLPPLPGLVQVNHKYKPDPAEMSPWERQWGGNTDCPAELTDHVLRVLLHCAPNLQQLSVGDISLRAKYSRWQWKVRSLEVAAAVNHPKAGGYREDREEREYWQKRCSEGVSLRELTWLPQPQCDQVPLTLSVVVCSVLTQEEVGLLSKYRIASGYHITLIPFDGRQGRDPGPALTSTLTVLWPHYEGDLFGEVQLYEWDVTDGVLEALAHLPQCETLRIRESDWHASTEQCKQLLPRLPQSCKSVILEDMTHNWDEKYREVMLAGGTGRCEVSTEYKHFVSSDSDAEPEWYSDCD